MLRSLVGSEMCIRDRLKMAQMARDLRAEGHDVISLSLGEPDFDTPQHIKDAAIQALNDGYTKYTPVPGLVELREAIVNKFKRDNNLDFDISQIVVSNGAKQSIANLSLTLLNEGDENKISLVRSVIAALTCSAVTLKSLSISDCKMTGTPPPKRTIS